MLSNPPYGKSWKTDLERMGGKGQLSDARFVVQHAGEELSLITRSSDGQLMFLVNKLAKMNGDPKPPWAAASPRSTTARRFSPATPARAKATSAAGSSRTTGWRPSSPCRLTCSTTRASPPTSGCLSNRKPEHRRGKVQLIDATGMVASRFARTWARRTANSRPSTSARSPRLFLAFEETEQSKIFPNAAFGYWKVTVERPLRIPGIDPQRVYKPAEIKQLKAEHGTDPAAPPVIRKKTKAGVEYEPDPELRDTEQVPLLEEGGIEAFFDREVLPHVPDAWIDRAKTQIGYEISFTRHFYKPTPLRPLEEIRADLQTLQAEAEGLLDQIVAPASEGGTR